MKTILLAALFFAGSDATASSEVARAIVENQHLIMSRELTLQDRLGWVAGDELNFRFILGLQRGALQMKVMYVGDEGAWMNQFLVFASGYQQEVKALYDVETGRVKRIFVNGEERQP